ncbi:Uncharacterized protein TCM_008189 [Theobroma cacao]|uniref:Uncharacterized protein n=1 Tax=Theobroma cacao TaxID=3641 RepID=A0A061E393_THECC|nr:Uncharacterized protein TCM_008189 [Theobroma cacao]
MESSSVQKTSISPNEDLRSPYFLYHTNHHGLVVINPKLTSSNYVTWSRSFMLALSIKYKKYFDQYKKDMVFRFIIGLNETFSALRSQVTIMEPFLTLDKVYNLDLQEDYQTSLLIQCNPDLTFWRVLGLLSLCYISTLTQHITKFDKKASKCVFLGYPNGTKGYKVYDIDAHKVLIFGNVVFHEHIFHFQHLQHTTDHYSFPQTIGMHDPIIDFFYFNSINSTSQAPLFAELHSSQSSSFIDIVSTSRPTHSLHNSPYHHSVVESVPSNSLTPTDYTSSLRRSTRIKHVPKYLDPYQVDLLAHVNHVIAYLMTNYLSSH